MIYTAIINDYIGNSVVTALPGITSCYHTFGLVIPDRNYHANLDFEFILTLSLHYRGETHTHLRAYNEITTVCGAHTRTQHTTHP